MLTDTFTLLFTYKTQKLLIIRTRTSFRKSKIINFLRFWKGHPNVGWCAFFETLFFQKIFRTLTEIVNETKYFHCVHNIFRSFKLIMCFYLCFCFSSVFVTCHQFVTRRLSRCHLRLTCRYTLCWAVSTLIET